MAQPGFAGGCPPARRALPREATLMDIDLGRIGLYPMLCQTHRTAETGEAVDVADRRDKRRGR